MASPYDATYNNIRDRIAYYANRYGIPVNVAIQQLWQESSFRNVCSYANACGIAQFIPDTAARYGVNVNDVESSLDGWGRYMSYMLGLFNGRIDIALAGYNSGENRQEYRNAAAQNRPINWSVLPSGVQSQTQNYVNIIMSKAGQAIPYNNTQPYQNTEIGSQNTEYLGSQEKDDTPLYLLAGLGALILLG